MANPIASQRNGIVLDSFSRVEVLNSVKPLQSPTHSPPGQVMPQVLYLGSIAFATVRIRGGVQKRAGFAYTLCVSLVHSSCILGSLLSNPLFLARPLIERRAKALGRPLPENVSEF